MLQHFRHIDYIEKPITNEKPKYYQVNDINFLVHNVAHIYHSDLTESLLPSNYDITIPERFLVSSSASHSSLHQGYLTTPKLLNIPYSHIYNVQLTSESS